MMLPFYDTAFESSVEDPTPMTGACSWMILFCTTFFSLTLAFWRIIADYGMGLMECCNFFLLNNALT
jgi:hypothetical protein